MTRHHSRREGGITSDSRKQHVRSDEICEERLARTERERQALERTRDTLQALIENTTTHLAYLDPAFNFVWVNSPYALGSGRSREELIGRNHFELFPNPENQAVFERVRETGQPVEFHAKPFEYADQPWRGTTYWDWTLTPDKDELGRVRGLVLSLQDVTDRIRAERQHEQLHNEIAAQRSLFQTVVENAAVGIAVLRGPDFVFELANPACQAIVPGKTLVGRKVAEAWPELASQVLPLLERVYRTGEPYRTVDAPFPVQRSAGGPIEKVYFTFAYIPLIDSRSQVNAILVLVIETTDHVHARQRTEQLARDARRRSAELQGIIDNMVDGVFVSDAEGRITLVNEAGVHMLGMDRPEEAKRLLAEFPELLRVRHPDGKLVSPGELPLVRALRGETVVQDDEIIHNPKTRRDVYLRISAAPIGDEAGKIAGAVALTRNVTELMELDRLKDQFIEVAAHELKTPVTGIKGFAQFLLQREHEGVSPRGRKALEAINRQADRIGSLVNDLLDISRFQTGQLELTMEKLDLRALVKEAVDRAALIAGDHRIRVRRGRSVFVRGDQYRLEQVLMNLLENAVKFSPKGGYVDVGVSVKNRRAVVSIRDYGVGIPKDKQGRIFQRFYRAHTGTPYDFGGMGIGLYISNEIVERHGGRMWFESEEGKGSTFYFSLPLA